MKLMDTLSQCKSIFIDTAPIIYYIEAHPKYGSLVVEIVNAFQLGTVLAYSSVRLQKFWQNLSK